jgi:hypothetical protein
LINPDDGILVISSPYTWRAEHTEIEKWIGGKYKDGEVFKTEDGLKQMVDKFSGGKMQWHETVKVPFVIPD